MITRRAFAMALVSAGFAASWQRASAGAEPDLLGHYIFHHDRALFDRLIMEPDATEIAGLSANALHIRMAEDFRSDRVIDVNAFRFSRTECIRSVCQHDAIIRATYIG